MNMWVPVLLILFGSLAVALAFYWTLVLPMFREKVARRIANMEDDLHLMGLSGVLNRESKSFARLSDFMRHAGEASQSQGWLTIRPVSKEELRAHEIELRCVLDDADAQPPEVRRMVKATVHDLVGVYLAQRPFLCVVLMVVAALAYWWRAAVKWRREMETSFAADSLARVGA